MNAYLENFINEKFKKPAKALDLGAGKFYDVAYLKYLGWKCEGVDINMGVNLEKYYLSPKKCFDLVYTNYLIQKIKNKNIFIKTCYDNLKPGGFLFIHTFDKSDKVINSGIDKSMLRNMLKEQGFFDIKTSVFSFYDNGHKHWHKVLEVTARKS